MGNGRVRLACDNAAVIQGINKRSIKDPALRPLQTILLLAALFDIELNAFWIPSEENIVTDAASRHQFDKLANLGFQDQITSLRRKTPATKISALRQKLHSYFSTQSRPPPDAITIQQDNHTNPCTPSINTHLPPSKSSKLAPILTISKPTWQLPDSYDMVNLRGIHGNHTHSTPQNNLQLQPLTPQAPRFPRPRRFYFAKFAALHKFAALQHFKLHSCNLEPPLACRD